MQYDQAQSILAASRQSPLEDVGKMVLPPIKKRQKCLDETNSNLPLLEISTQLPRADASPIDPNHQSNNVETRHSISIKSFEIVGNVSNDTFKLHKDISTSKSPSNYFVSKGKNKMGIEDNLSIQPSSLPAESNHITGLKCTTTNSCVENGKYQEIIHDASADAEDTRRSLNGISSISTTTFQTLSTSTEFNNSIDLKCTAIKINSIENDESRETIDDRLLKAKKAPLTEISSPTSTACQTSSAKIDFSKSTDLNCPRTNKNSAENDENQKIIDYKGLKEEKTPLTETSASSTTCQTTSTPTESNSYTSLKGIAKEIKSSIQSNENWENEHKKDIEEDTDILSELFQWTDFLYLNKIEQEILWLTEISSFVFQYPSSERKMLLNLHGNILEESIDEDIKEQREKLMFKFVLKKMSPELKEAIETKFGRNNHDGIIDTNSKLIRMGIRLQSPNTKCEFIEKRGLARIRLKQYILKKQKKSKIINERWAQWHDKESNALVFKIREKVFLFEKSNNCSLPQKCYCGEILGLVRTMNNYDHNDSSPESCVFLYSIMLDNSTIEHGIVTQSIFNQSDIDKMKESIMGCGGF